MLGGNIVAVIYATVAQSAGIRLSGVNGIVWRVQSHF